MPQSNLLTVRRILITFALAIILITAGCGSLDTEESTSSETEPSPDKTLNHEENNLSVYTDNTAITVVNYPDSMKKTIYWEDETVCTRWNSAQEGGVSCIPFNETQIDDRYDPPANV